MGASSPSPAIFSERLRQARELRRMSQADLAQRAGFQPSAVSHFETGTRKPSFDNLRRLADALEVSTDFLLGKADEPSGAGPADVLFRDFERMSASDRDFIRKMAAELAAKNRG